MQDISVIKGEINNILNYKLCSVLFCFDLQWGLKVAFAVHFACVCVCSETPFVGGIQRREIFQNSEYEIKSF